MNGRLDSSIIQRFRDQFERNCITFLLDGYRSLRASGGGFAACDENDLTVRLVGCMKKNPLASEYQISIVRESYEDTEESYAGKKKANKSPRVDIKYITWKDKTEHGYRMEAKNLAFNNFPKPPNRSLVNALKLRKRYIETGIAHFLDGTYGEGCLLGYIREGEITPIVGELNQLLLTGGRRKEQLWQENGFGFEDQYASRHEHKGLVLKHFFLDFCE